MSERNATQKENLATRLEPPPNCRVLMHNDDYTTMDFVVEILRRVFGKSAAEANQIMLLIHTEGEGVCGVYPFDIAETKVLKVHSLARAAGFPLRCSITEV